MQSCGCYYARDHGLQDPNSSHTELGLLLRLCRERISHHPAIGLRVTELWLLYAEIGRPRARAWGGA